MLKTAQPPLQYAQQAPSELLGTGAVHPALRVPSFSKLAHIPLFHDYTHRYVFKYLLQTIQYVFLRFSLQATKLPK